jgi:hypothetical protein
MGLDALLYLLGIRDRYTEAQAQSSAAPGDA